MEFETVLIGSGVAATIVARCVLEADPDHALLILEAGPRVELKERRSWWDYVISGRAAYAHCHDLPLPPDSPDPVTPSFEETENASIGPNPWIFQESRVMAFGGSTTHWGGWALRFKEEDFELRSRTGRGADWPISYQDLEPFYGDAEHLLSVAGNDNDHWTPRARKYPLPRFEFTEADGPMIAAFERLGIKYGTMPIARYRKCMTTGTCKYCPIGARFAARYLLDELTDPPGRHPNLVIRTRCPVSQLLHDRKDRVAGVRYLDVETGRTREVRGNRFVVCAGAIETPKLLLRSRSRDWPNGLGNDHDHVGRNVISHTLIYAQGRTRHNPHRSQQELDFPVLMSRHYDTPDTQRDGKLFLFRDRTTPGVKLAALMSAGKTREQVLAEVEGPATWSLQGFMEEFANPDNRVELGDGLNRLGLPQTRIRFARAEGFEQAAAVRLSWMSRVIEAMGLGDIETRVTSVRGDHAASTCRMARSPEDGVVDPDLAVFGVENLFLCSNAVFPSGAAVNPTLTLSALSLRLGRLLTGRSVHEVARSRTETSGLASRTPS